MQNFKIYLILLLQAMILSAVVHAKAITTSSTLSNFHKPLIEYINESNPQQSQPKQLLTIGNGKETSTPDFVRLLVMRLIYGVASTMGVEDRLETLFNGIFTPPNADSDIFGFGSIGDGGDDGGDELIGDFFDI